MLFLAVPVATTVVGAAKGAQAAGRMGEAKRIADEAAAKYQVAQERFDAARATAVDQLAAYGMVRLRAYDDELRRLQVVLERLNAARELQRGTIDLSLADKVAGLRLEDVDFAAIVAVKIGLVAAGAGAASYLAAFAAAESLGAVAVPAAGGIPIWLLGGGGAAAGGMGVARVGAAVLGGVALAPVLTIGALVLSAKAGKRLEEAKVYAAKVDRAVEELLTAGRAVYVIGKRAVGFTEVTNELCALLRPRLSRAEAMMGGDLTEADRRDLHVTFELARTLKLLLDTPLVTGDGYPSSVSADVLGAAKRAAGSRR